MSDRKQVLIIGAGPAGLTAAHELLAEGGPTPIVFESLDLVGGISRTVCHGGNRMDVGGHRFFSKSDWVMDWWARILPVNADGASHHAISYQNKTRDVTPATSSDPDRVMLLRPRLSRIYFLKRFFDYPVRLNLNTIRNLGPIRLTRILFSYLRTRVFPIQQINNLEDFFISRFGRELYLTFFKDYTEKVWGVSCRDISAEWGAQRIKGLSILSTLKHAFKQIFKQLMPSPTLGFASPQEENTSLIEQFLYPKLGPGQMWEEVARHVQSVGGEVHLRHAVRRLHWDGLRITGLTVENLATGELHDYQGDYVISTMPIRELIHSLAGHHVPAPVRAIADGLAYRDFISVGLLVRKFRHNRYSQSSATNMLPDNWIYIQERDVKLGRLQIFNNWSPYMVKDPEHSVWLGLEYFCNEGDPLWSMADADFLKFAASELGQIGLIDPVDVLDGTVLRVPKAYPAYFGSYDRFDTLRHFVDTIPNLFLVGRNGMHRYNNQDHSMLTARLAVEAILAGSTDKAAIWAVNIDDDYHEDRTRTNKVA